MRYMTFRNPAGDVRAGIIDQSAPEKIADVTSLLPPGNGGPMRRLIAAVTAGTDPRDLARRCPALTAAEVNVLAPVTDPTKVVAAPVNYRYHMEEMSEAARSTIWGSSSKPHRQSPAAGARFAFHTWTAGSTRRASSPPSSAQPHATCPRPPP